MSTKNTRARKAPSKRSPRVSQAAIHKALLSIADRAFSHGFNEMIRYIAQVNPRGTAYVRQYLRATRAVLEDREADARQQKAARQQRKLRRIAA